MHNTSPITMKHTRFCKFIALSLLLCLSLSGCKRGTKGLTVIPQRGAGIVADTTKPGPPANVQDSRGRAIPQEDTTRSNLITRDYQTPLPNERWDPSNYNEDR